MTVAVVLAVAGVAALFFSIWGGGIKAKEVEIPAPPRKARLTVGVVGLVFLATSIWLSVPHDGGNSQTPAFEFPTSTIPTPTTVKLAEATITRSQIEKWNLGETTEANVNICLDENGKLPEPEIYFKKGEIVPKGVLFATGLWGDGGAHWNQLPVKPICVYNDWGLFESTNEFQAVSDGGYRIIVP